MSRINFAAWGMGDLDCPAYAIRGEDHCYESDGALAVGAIARKNGLEVCTCRQDGQSLDKRGKIEASVYQATLGYPCRGGGWTPVRQVWVSVPIDQNG